MRQPPEQERPDPSRPLDPDVLIRLIDRLNSYPIGLPDAPEIREFLSIFLTPDEALVASRFPLREATAAEIAESVGWERARAETTLDAMAEKGAVIDFDLAGSRYWLLSPSVIGFVEFSLMKTNQGLPLERLARLLDRYSESALYKEVFGSDTPLTRALVGQGVPVTSRIATYSQVEKVVRDAGRGALQICYCRHKQHLLGQECKVATHESTCVALGRAADFVIRRGFGRAASADEILKAIKALGDKGLIHVTDNVRDEPSFVCNCCGCCCGLLSGVIRRRAKTAVAPTPFLATVDRTRCTGCAVCTKRCQVGALGPSGGSGAERPTEPAPVGPKRDPVRVDATLCLGCGACVASCHFQALSLTERPDPPTLPANAITKFVRIAWDKGRLWPLVKTALRKRVLKLLRG